MPKTNTGGPGGGRAALRRRSTTAGEALLQGSRLRGIQKPRATSFGHIFLNVLSCESLMVLMKPSQGLTIQKMAFSLKNIESVRRRNRLAGCAI